MSERVSSRLVKKETNKLLRRTVLMTGGSLILIVVFLFIVLPNFIKLVVWFSGDTQPAAKEFQFVQPPVIQPPVNATKEKEIEISGYGRSGHEVIFVINGVETGRETAGEDGAFSIKLLLSQGDNSITAYQVGPDGSESETGEAYTVKFDNTAPELELESPAEDTEVSGKDKQLFTVKGKVNEQAEIYVNDRVTFINEENAFSYSYQLKEGDNDILIKVIDEAGNTTEVSKKVKYRK